MFKIYDGRTSFYQYDLNRKLVIEDKTITKVHFCNRTGSCSIIRCAYEVNGLWLVDVPNVILQESYRINVYGFDSEYTKHSASFNVVARTKPEDYVYTENEVATWEALEERITQIEENGVSDETIAAAISEYLVENPIEAGATAEQVAAIEANSAAIQEIESNYVSTEYVEGAIANAHKNYYTKAETDAAIANAQIGGGSGGNIDLSNYYTKAQTDAAIKAAKPDLTGYATQSWVEGKGYLTQHQDLSKYALKTEIPDVSGYQTAEQVQTAIENYVGVIENGSY